MSLPKNPISQQDVDREARICAELVGRSLGAYLKTVGLVSEAYLSQVLVALWDSGIYEYVREHGRVDIGVVSQELSLEPEVLRSLIEYLVGWGIMAPVEESFVLTAKGGSYWNYI